MFSVGRLCVNGMPTCFCTTIFKQSGRSCVSYYPTKAGCTHANLFADNLGIPEDQGICSTPRTPKMMGNGRPRKRWV